MDIPGFSRKDVYRQFARAVRTVIESGVDQVEEETETDMVTKVNVQDTVNRLVNCPVCEGKLLTYDDEPLARFCDCGEFTIKDVYSDGDVMFEFRLVAPAKIVQLLENEEDEPDHDDRV